jgi:hypothetical protein
MGFGQFSYNARSARPDFSSASSVPKPKKRLAHVVDNPAHIWAHPRQKDGSGFEQDNARVAGGRWYFKTSSDGTRVIFSYRDSYVIGSRFELGRKTIFLLRSGKAYSITTSGHMSGTRNAVPKNTKGVEVFTVPAMVHGYDHGKPGAQEHTYNLEFYVSEIKTLLEAYASARCSWKMRTSLTGARERAEEAKRYAKVFKLKLPALPVVPKMDQAKLDAIVQRELTRDQRRDEKRRVEREAYERQHSAEVKAWMEGPDACKHVGTDGKPQHSYGDRWSCQRQRENEEWEANKAQLIEAWKRGEKVQLKMQYSEPALLRVRTFGADEDVAGLVGCVETSMQVQVPISGPAGAARLFRFLKALKDAGRTYQRNGHSQHIGNFVVDSFDGSVLNAGCHTITWEEILSVSDAVLTAEQPEGSA